MNSSHLLFSKQVRGPSSRSKLACEQCRERHVKCDQQRPCGICVRRKVQCSHGGPVEFTPLEWQPGGATVVPEPARRSRSSPSRIVGFVDETPDVSELYHVLPAEPADGTSAISPANTAEGGPLPPVRTDATTPIRDEKEAFYLARYADIIGPRFDMFDSTSRYFTLVLPHVALRDRLVLLACIASAARQYSLVTNRGHHDALAYYNEAIKALSDRLNGSRHEAATFASCLLIAHCEMVESKASDWILHLKGTGELLAMLDWNGRCGGLAQASFWIYCRMVILASLSSGVPAAVDLGRLLRLAYVPDPPEWTIDTWQRKTVYLLGCVQDFWDKTRAQHDAVSRQEELMSQWQEVGDRVLQHDAEAPGVCQALSITAANGEIPFEAVRYINGPVAAAWQMLHTAYLIHTLSRPVPRSARFALLSSPAVADRALQYARKIVSNSIVNACTIAWANAVQLLTVAGRCLVEARERQACLRVLDDIQHHTGWDTRTNMEKLSRAWRHGRAAGRTPHAITGCKPLDDEMTDLGLLLYNAWRGDEDPN
ncbi:hypothetical protein VTK73DRAFT_1173 [Phialemonium thermophilum]|uniref:Zn(2)-C6 fungal-type domain-containing protein n=1 Tax=Phialemonium thermophilum TaxID=223376 RepID=A0ABR3XAX7_9PEZI